MNNQSKIQARTIFINLVMITNYLHPFTFTQRLTESSLNGEMKDETKSIFQLIILKSAWVRQRPKLF